MRLTIVAATGRVGRELLGQALTAGHEITAVVRDPARLPTGTLIRPVRADFADPDPANLRDAVQGADAVLSAVGPAPSSEAGVASRATAAIASAMQDTRVRRLVVVSAAPVGPVSVAGRRPGRPDPGDDVAARLVLGPVLRRIFRAQYADLAEMEEVLRSSGLAWTAIRPPRLTDGPVTGTYRTAMGRNLKGGRQIARADVAHLMLAVLDRPETVGETVGIAV